MGKAAENKQQKKDALMRTAFDLFSKNGVAGTTIADIAAKAGVGKGTFYSYFKDKADIHDHIVVHISAQVFARAKAELDRQKLTSLEDQILFLADNIIDQLTADRLLLKFISKNLSWGVFHTAMKEEYESQGINFSRLFQDAFDRSPVKYKNPLILIYMIIEFVNSTCCSAILEDRPLPIAELKPYIFDSIRAIMRAQEIEAPGPAEE